MDAKRVTIYSSYTAVIDLRDAQALAPENDLEPLVENIASTVLETFHTDVVGYTWDRDMAKLFVTFKHRNQAERLALDWQTVMDIVMDEETSPE